MYWASGASHGPHQVPKEWADKYKGKFDDGWDKYRERVFERQSKWAGFRQMRMLHATPRRRWLHGTPFPMIEKPFQRRLMEVYAGFTEHADYAGRPRDR